MSHFSAAYDALAARLAVVLPTHKRISDPNNPEANPEKDLVSAWGMRIGPGVNTNGEFCNIMSINRTFDIILTRRMAKRDTDTVGRADVEKQLFEDQELVISDIEKDPTLNNSIAVCTSAYVSDGGIEFVHTEKDNFLKLSTVIEVQYRKDLN